MPDAATAGADCDVLNVVLNPNGAPRQIDLIVGRTE
jgi:hypothetical protein